jgi:hypothetical protein
MANDLSSLKIGRPLDLQRVLEDFNPRDSNITVDNLEENVIGYIESGINWFVTCTPMSDQVYFFLRVEDPVVSVRLAGHYEVYIALNPDLYGFTFEKSDINPTGLDINLVPEAAYAYNNLLNTKRIPINNLLETVGFVINRSMRYDLEGLIHKSKDKNIEPLNHSDIIEQYNEEGDEVTTGLCTDAGQLIRLILKNLYLPSRYLFTPVKAAEASPISHDTTLFVDTISGRWAVINSKSLTKTYNLVPKDRILELGKPYAA